MRCQANVKSGNRCSRNAKGEEVCWQHQPVFENNYTLETLAPVGIQETLLNLDDASLSQACRTNKRFNAVCQLDNFWYLRSQRYFRNRINEKKEAESWRQFYRRVRSPSRTPNPFIRKSLTGTTKYSLE